MGVPGWLRGLGVAVTLGLMALLLAGMVAVPLRSLTSPEQGTEARVHFNTKLSTRFAGERPGEVAAAVTRAVYPATPPDVVIAYPLRDWRAGLAAASLIWPLKAVLVPDDGNLAELVESVRPPGAAGVGGVRLLAVGDVATPPGVSSRRVAVEEVAALRMSLRPPPRRAVVVSARDPGTALLAGPWAGYSGDLVVFDRARVPAGVPAYALGAVDGGEYRARIGGGDPVRTAVAFAGFFDRTTGFGWNINASTATTGYRGFVLANVDDPASAVLAANLGLRGKQGPLLWSGRQVLPQRVNDFLWSQRPAFWTVPNEGPFAHVYVLGGTEAISFAAQSQADYALEIGPYRMKGPGAAGMDMLAAVWLLLGMAGALWIAAHQARYLPDLHWVMRLAWPLWALLAGPLGIAAYWLAYRWPVLRHQGMSMWDRPLWAQGMAATIASVGFGGALMIATAWLMTFFGLPLIPNHLPSWLFLLGSPMICAMIGAYVVAVGVSWPLYQTPMIAMFHGQSYRRALWTALPVVLVSMTSVALAMFPGMWCQ